MQVLGIRVHPLHLWLNCGFQDYGCGADILVGGFTGLSSPVFRLRRNGRRESRPTAGGKACATGFWNHSQALTYFVSFAIDTTRLTWWFLLSNQASSLFFDISSVVGRPRMHPDGLVRFWSPRSPQARPHRIRPSLLLRNEACSRSNRRRRFRNKFQKKFPVRFGALRCGLVRRWHPALPPVP